MASRLLPSILAERPHVVVLAVLLALSWAGCGYRSQIAPSATERSSGRAVRVAVETLRNDSREPWLDRVVGDALRRELASRGRFELVADPAGADYVVRGRVRPVDQQGSSFSALVVAAEYRLTLSLDLEVVRRAGHVLRLAPAALRETEHYLASPDVEVMRTNRLEAFRRLSDLIAARVADSLDGLVEPIAEARP